MLMVSNMLVGIKMVKQMLQGGIFIVNNVKVIVEIGKFIFSVCCFFVFFKLFEFFNLKCSLLIEWLLQCIVLIYEN